MKRLLNGFGFPFYMLLITFVSCLSCKKYVEVDSPKTNINAGNVYESTETAAAVLTGIYTNLSKAVLTSDGLISLPVYTGISGDELTLFVLSNQKYFPYYTNQLVAQGVSFLWNASYPIIYVTNSAIDGLGKSKKIPATIKNTLIGEAKFIRAFCLFNLYNIYGDIPVPLGTDYKTNSSLVRLPGPAVYNQIIEDLLAAKSVLSDSYVDGSISRTTTERVRPNKWAAIALLARVYLYTGEFTKAAEEASLLINNTSLFSLTDLGSTFLKNNSESIWQLQPVNIGWNTNEARFFVLPSNGPRSTFPVYISSFLANSFEVGDKRKISWIDKRTVGLNTYYFPNKYKDATFNAPVIEYHTVLRLAEQLLIRAEARVQLGGYTGALTDINMIRSRAGLPDTLLNDKAGLLKLILHERQVELFTEWGHRWFDLKRTKNLDFVMATVTPQKSNGLPWVSSQSNYPVGLNELERNSRLTQNPGY